MLSENYWKGWKYVDSDATPYLQTTGKYVNGWKQLILSENTGKVKNKSTVMLLPTFK